MIRLGEDDAAPRVDSMDTEKHSAERWPPDTSPPQNIWWVKSQWIPSIHKWHHLLSPCQHLAGCAAASRHIRHFRWSHLKQNTLPKVFLICFNLCSLWDQKKFNVDFFSLSLLKHWFPKAWANILSDIAFQRINFHTCACTAVCE